MLLFDITYIQMYSTTIFSWYISTWIEFGVHRVANCTYGGYGSRLKAQQWLCSRDWITQDSNPRVFRLIDKDSTYYAVPSVEWLWCLVCCICKFDVLFAHDGSCDIILWFCVFYSVLWLDVRPRIIVTCYICGTDLTFLLKCPTVLVMTVFSLTNEWQTFAVPDLDEWV